jgi:uncharacterized protein
MAKSLYARVLSALLTTIADTSALAASFDCAKATTQVEQTLCASRDLSDLDEKGRLLLASMVAWTASSHDL